MKNRSGIPYKIKIFARSMFFDAIAIQKGYGERYELGLGAHGVTGEGVISIGIGDHTSLAELEYNIQNVIFDLERIKKKIEQKRMKMGSRPNMITWPK